VALGAAVAVGVAVPVGVAVTVAVDVRVTVGEVVATGVRVGVDVARTCLASDGVLTPWPIARETIMVTTTKANLRTKVSRIHNQVEFFRVHRPVTRILRDACDDGKALTSSAPPPS
jgi:hypothetical protein